MLSSHWVHPLSHIMDFCYKDRRKAKREVKSLLRGTCRLLVDYRRRQQNSVCLFQFNYLKERVFLNIIGTTNLRLLLHAFYSNLQQQILWFYPPPPHHPPPPNPHCFLGLEISTYKQQLKMGGGFFTLFLCYFGKKHFSLSYNTLFINTCKYVFSQ